ncbi:MAG: thiamine-phosphate diphosphorylase [Candidatus Muproteobacteria bacterium RBG_16_64_10]|uniref:Thiamine-phosphate synthase n=1 Tax=Candidatus Muproteobacteria bacterium RBG_16_64_10 TaxID=1817757 RepID=A0A1F6T797_9PROT|nr:MAG: thiamine-phosphate diphosphorylase [Candidatus Muproteobacteria bacterium RBG_16_64_10]
MKPRLHGLYAIADTHYLEAARLAPAVEAAIAGGARVVQYRDKRHDATSRVRQARGLAAICRRHGVLFLVNDDVVLAKEAGADGVHLGRGDVPPAEARRRLGPGMIIGVSCYNELERALAAERAGADYVAFGSFFPSRTKPQAVRATPDLLREAKQRLHIPVVAIGGVTPENGAALIEAGADMLAVIEGVFAQPDVSAAARRYARLFPET